jgi:hypothetical protein
MVIVRWNPVPVVTIPDAALTSDKEVKNALLMTWARSWRDYLCVCYSFKRRLLGLADLFPRENRRCMGGRGG